MKNHDKVFEEMTAEQKEKFINGEILIVTEKVSKRGKTKIEKNNNERVKILHRNYPSWRSQKIEEI